MCFPCPQNLFGHAGKVQYLREQFLSHGLNFLGLQETRSQSGSLSVSGVLRLCAGCLQGTLEVELWCNLRQPYGFHQGKPQFFHKKHFAVTHADPRRLITRVDTPLGTWWICVLHAPQSGQPLHDRQLWWTETIGLIDSQVEDHERLFVCIDANAAPGTADGQCVFAQGLPTSSSTPLLRQFMTQYELCAPATGNVHEGPRETWTSSMGQTTHQIDYVLIPASLATFCTFSSVLEDLDLGNSHDDHLATGLEVKWTQLMSTSTKGFMATSAASFDRQLIQHSTLQQALQSPLELSWSCDVETQVQAVNEHFHSALQQHCPARRVGPKKPYVTDLAWKLRRQKLAHRKQLKHCKALLLRETMARIFHAWRSPLTQLTEGSFVFGTTLRCGLLKHLAGFRRRAQELQYSLTEAKRLRLTEVLAEIDEHTAASEIQHKLRGFIGPTNKLRQGLAPLPALCNDQGAPCLSAAEVLNRWISFFADMEGGTRVSTCELHQRWLADLQSLSDSHQILHIAEIPSLCALEAACRRTKSGKASGPDQLPSELCKFFAPATARALYPLLLKVITH